MTVTQVKRTKKTDKMGCAACGKPTTSQKMVVCNAQACSLQKSIIIASLSGVASIVIIGFVITVIIFKLKSRPPAPERGRVELNPIYGDYCDGEPEYSTVTDDNPYYEVIT